ncbi:aminoglycoside 6-adenylyltransferase [Sphingobacterium spiritivorum]|uniref:aminoglycoside 6-adenylyltransferase n=1 Tax=Sphingobacterium spiritivorum TaxID=258 RepID=UPI00191930FE|nr:aminoglycoside 6-adenylyltransferase [Sphingobacterium spiritivorum]QQT26106.1 aminoglycoside 6-adenylyltransferase [Sphingobacterium spiritivorum]
MRTASEIQNMIVAFGETDSRIRAILLNGSRANPAVKPDKFQDYDIVFVVNEIDSFTKDPTWIDIFGERIIMQLPDAMTYLTDDPGQDSESFAYLMLFTDFNRIDLTLFPVNKLDSHKQDSLTTVWLDKDGLFAYIDESSERDYYISKPAEQEFAETCNEFWWVSTYVVKGLYREEITYAKEAFDLHIRPMFMNVLAWKIGMEHNFEVTFGKSGKYMQQYLSEKHYQRILNTYANHNIEENWKALFTITELFAEFSMEVAERLAFPIDSIQQQNVMKYIQTQYALFQKEEL